MGVVAPTDDAADRTAPGADGRRRARTDGAGRVDVCGLLGDYQLHCADHTASFTVAMPGESVTTVRLEK